MLNLLNFRPNIEILAKKVKFLIKLDNLVNFEILAKKVKFLIKTDTLLKIQILAKNLISGENQTFCKKCKLIF